MMLSYSFETRITSGYLKGTPSANIESLVDDDLRRCLGSAGHPLLLPTLQLCRQLSLDNDETQRRFRHEVRKLEEILVSRYRDPEKAGTVKGRNSAMAGVAKDRDPATVEAALGQDSTTTKAVEDRERESELAFEETINKLHNFQCQVLWKRPKAWQNVVSRMADGNKKFRGILDEQKQGDAPIHKVCESISNRLYFLQAKLEGLENYTQVTVDRMDMLRGLVSYMKGCPAAIMTECLSVRIDQYDDRANRVDTQPGDSGRD